jgi:hypothetical protein
LLLLLVLLVLTLHDPLGSLLGLGVQLFLSGVRVERVLDGNVETGLDSLPRSTLCELDNDVLTDNQKFASWVIHLASILSNQALMWVKRSSPGTPAHEARRTQGKAIEKKIGKQSVSVSISQVDN